MAPFLNRGSGSAAFRVLDVLRRASTKAADHKKSVNVQATAPPLAAAEERETEGEYWVREQVPKPNRTSSFLYRPLASVPSLC